MSPTLRRWIRIRRILGGIASLFFTLAAMAVVDGIQHMARQDPFRLVLIPGEHRSISGWIPGNTTDPPIVRAETPLEWTIHGNQTGYFLGGAQWLGSVHVPSHAAPGHAAITVHFPGAPPQIFHVHIVATSQEARAQAKSLLLRYLGAYPYLGAGILVLLGLAAALGGYRISCRIEQYLATHGFTELFIDRRGILTLPWGTQHGLSQGQWVELVDDEGQHIGRAMVIDVWDNHSRAQCHELRGYVLTKWRPE